MHQLLLLNGNILTLDRAGSRARALLAQEGRILRVGENDEVAAHASPQALRIDLRGRTAVPGFNDNHLHAAGAGHHFTRPLLYGMDAGEIVEFLRAHYAASKPGEALTAFGWDYEHCPDPHRRLLDAAFPRNPVILYQFSGHGVWVNSQALRLMGIDRRTPDPPEGRILRDPDGEPTGVLREVRNNPYLRRLYASRHRNPRAVRGYLRRALSEFRRLGITSIQDNTWFPRVLDAFVWLEDRGELTCRTTYWFRGEDPLSARLMQWRRVRSALLKPGPWKYFLDGTFSTRTAWLMEPYADEPDHCGLGKDSAEIARLLEPHVRAPSPRSRRQVACHAIGDRAVKAFLDAVELLARRYPWIPQMRLRLEHAQLIREEDVPRLARLGVLVAAQPHALGDPEKDLRLLGPRRFERAYPYRWLLDAGVALSFGSDFPGEPTLDPMLALSYAAARSGSQRITAEEALRCYTAGSAYAEFQEEHKGTLEPGKVADIVVLSADPLTVPAERLRDLQVELTILGGRVIYDRATAPAA